MTDISKLKVISIDEERPPMIRKEGYIDLFFNLSDKAPEDWCDIFNALGHRIKPPVKVNPKNGLEVKTYVHDMQLIQAQLDKIKEKVAQCNEEYLEKERQKKLALAATRADMQGSNAKQNQLNEIIALLKF